MPTIEMQKSSCIQKGVVSRSALGMLQTQCPYNICTYLKFRIRYRFIELGVIAEVCVCIACLQNQWCNSNGNWMHSDTQYAYAWAHTHHTNAADANLCMDFQINNQVFGSVSFGACMYSALAHIGIYLLHFSPMMMHERKRSGRLLTNYKTSSHTHSIDSLKWHCLSPM